MISELVVRAGSCVWQTRRSIDWPSGKDDVTIVTPWPLVSNVLSDLQRDSLSGWRYFQLKSVYFSLWCCYICTIIYLPVAIDRRHIERLTSSLSFQTFATSWLFLSALALNSYPGRFQAPCRYFWWTSSIGSDRSVKVLHFVVQRLLHYDLYSILESFWRIKFPPSSPLSPPPLSFHPHYSWRVRCSVSGFNRFAFSSSDHWLFFRAACRVWKDAVLLKSLSV